MQSSVLSNTLCLGDLGTFSNDFVHISKEVSITSSPAPTSPAERPLISTLPRHAQRTHSSDSVPFNSSTVQLAGWNSFSKGSQKSSIYQRTQMSRRSSGEHDLLESNRESMKALADFLMTREPPPTNWVSNQSSDDEGSLSGFKKSAFRLLGKNKKKKTKTPKLLQLPDSAVAAKTIEGFRHIAISIPLVHDLMANRPDSPVAIKLQKKDGQRERTDRSAVHVLKPLPEVRESAERDINRLTSPNETITQSPTLGENTGTYLNYRVRARTEPSNAPKYDPKRTQKSYVAVSPTAMQRQDSQRSDPRHSGGTTYSTTSIASQQAGHSRQPSSVSTAPSAVAGQSTVLSGLKLDLPLRNSSISKVPKAIQAELALASAKIEKRDKERLVVLPSPSASLGPKLGNETFISGTSSTPPPLILLGTASRARKYSGAGLDGPAIVRSNTPITTDHISPQQPSPPPDKSLPDIPVGATSNKATARPRTAPPLQGAEREVSKRTSSTREREAGPRSSRQERVKERKQRDIEALRSNLSPRRESNTHRDSTLNPTAAGRTISAIPPRHPKLNGISSTERRRMANNITPIMAVADLPPHPMLAPFTHHQYSKQSSSSTIRAFPSSNIIKTTYLEPKPREENQQTPPHSPLTPLPSDFPQIPAHHSTRHSLPAPSSKFRDRSPVSISSNPPNSPSLSPFLSHSPSLNLSPNENDEREEYNKSYPNNTRTHRRQSLRTSILSTRRQERRTKRNLSLREQELDARLEKIERDNAILLQTLGLISRSFGFLGRRLEVGVEEVEGSGGETGMGRGREGMREKESRGELRGMEPSMWEFQGGAPKFSGETMIRDGQRDGQRQRERDRFGDITWGC